MTLVLRSHGLTDQGRVRPHNEDAFFSDDQTGLYVVADGMGGSAAGEVASLEAIDTIVGMVRRGAGTLDAYRRAPFEENAAALSRLVESAVQGATYMVFGLAELNPQQKGMGTTVSLLLVVGTRAFLAWVGDSRIYQARGGEVVQLTEDHTLVNLQVKHGLLTPEEAKRAKHGNIITRAVGVKEYVEVDTLTVDVQPGDRFVLCSDGLCGYLDEPRDLLPFLKEPDLSACARSLVDFANGRGGKDNITVIVIEARAG